jgi:hypothetical protein
MEGLDYPRSEDAWLSLRSHIWDDHPDEELCLSCNFWFEDTVFQEHLKSTHGTAWKDIKTNEEK